MSKTTNEDYKDLALDPEPEVRECPRCKHTIMRNAKICGYCWTKPEPITEQAV